MTIAMAPKRQEDDNAIQTAQRSERNAARAACAVLLHDNAIQTAQRSEPDRVNFGRTEAAE